ncbi:MAG: hypothetical protein U1F61_16965 [Opitutaceae bacterium]
MTVVVEVYPPLRECRFCLCLQQGSVYADFYVDGEGRAFLRRISFDGYGCCSGDFKKMELEDSRLLIAAVESRTIGDDAKVKALLQSYFRDNTHLIWSDALACHELV